MTVVSLLLILVLLPICAFATAKNNYDVGVISVADMNEATHGQTNRKIRPKDHASILNNFNSVNKNTNKNSNNNNNRILQQVDNNEKMDSNNRNDDDDDNKNEYIDFTKVLDASFSEDSNDPFMSMLSDLVLWLRDYLHSSVDEDESENSPKINELLGGLLDENGFVRLHISGGFFIDLGAESTANLTSVGVGGLDTIREPNLLRPSKNNQTDASVATTTATTAVTTTLQNSFVLDTLVLDLYVTETIASTTTTTTTATTTPTTNEATIRLSFSGVEVSNMPIRLALWEKGLREFPLGAALDPFQSNNVEDESETEQENRLLACLKHTVVDDARILSIDTSFETIVPPRVLASASNDVGSPFFNILTTLFVGLPVSVPIFFNTTVRGLLNDLLEDNLVVGEDTIDGIGPEHACPSYPKGIEDHPTLGITSTTNNNNNNNNKKQGLIDFRSFFENGLPAMLTTSLLDENLLANNPETGLPRINDVLIRPMIIEAIGQESGAENGNNDNQTTSTTTTTPTTSFVLGPSGGEEPLLDVDTTIEIGGLFADVRMLLSDLRIHNLDTMIQPLELLRTLVDRPHQLNNTVTMGLKLPTAAAATATAAAADENNNDKNSDRAMGVSAKIFVSIETDTGGSIQHNLDVRVQMEALSFVLTALLEVVEARLYGFPVQDIVNLQCWLATIETPPLDNTTGLRREDVPFTAGIADLQASLGKMIVNVACVKREEDDGDGDDSNYRHCTSPGMVEWIKLLETSDAQAGATDAMNSFLAYAASLLSAGGEILQSPIDRILNEAPMQCPHSPHYDPLAVFPVAYEQPKWPSSEEQQQYNVGYLVLWGSLALGIITTIALAVFGVKYLARRRHKRWLEQSDEATEAAKQRLAREQAEQAAFQGRLDAATGSMFFSREEISVVVRLGMPLVILGNIALFLSGHLNLGATVYIEGNFAGETIQVDDFFDFAIARSTIDIWRAGGKALAILILIFSGIWPYTKQLLTLVLWFLPPSWMSVSKRGSFLIWIDRLAKWSMIDIFVIVICIAAFRVSVKSPEVAFLTEEFYSIDLLVVPMWGLYANMIAQLVSQVSSHFIIHYHRSIVQNATEALEESSNKESDTKTENRILLVRTHRFSRPHHQHSEDDDRLVVHNWVGPTLLVLCALMAVLVILGCFLPSFSIEILGLIGIAVESGQDFEPAITRHSVYSIVAMLWDEARFLDTPGDYAGIGVLSCLFLATVLVVPILQSLGLVYQWFVPLSETGRRWFLVGNEILQAWQYIEVYLIALFVASWQLGPVSDYMFNAYCGSLDVFLADMVRYGVVVEADAQCFRVEGSIDPGSLWLFAAAALLALLNSVVTRAANDALRDSSETTMTTGDARARTEEAPSNSPLHERTDRGSNTVDLVPVPIGFSDLYPWLLRKNYRSNSHDDKCTDDGSHPKAMTAGAVDQEMNPE
eukprot:CAMPEP_0201146050 /NCGR_PEP_ID=MMETSP0851-20130426/7775_1 /ASSEMBLY_ACC=CAM_ASM_000631 /TAXON_ID=183588 /ORGANISM="Pseudo-nitzschia fraudulenta, Strain WWA7" /LENGTH=1436 /DNA_ID=CAMNT_0047421477 /DNA_START=89 /DNA_END=4399 /DNA_ORIENTATION=+